MPHYPGVWEGNYPEPTIKKRADFPANSSGVHPDFDRPWHGDRETDFHTLSSLTNQATNMLGNILLYRGFKKPGAQIAQGTAVVPAPPVLPPPSVHKQSRIQTRGLNAGPQPAGAVGAGTPSPLALNAGPRVHVSGPAGGTTATPLGPVPGRPMPARSGTTFDPRKPGGHMGNLDLGPKQGYGRSGFQPDLTPSMNEPTTRRPAGMDPRKRGTWLRVD